MQSTNVLLADFAHSAADAGDAVAALADTTATNVSAIDLSLGIRILQSFEGFGRVDKAHAGSQAQRI
jgi:hypothetical protein